MRAARHPSLGIGLVVAAAALLLFCVGPTRAVSPRVLSTTSPPSALAVSYATPYGPNETCDPDTVTIGFLASVQGGSAPYNFTWNFGDHSRLGYGQNVQHTYPTWAPPNVTVWVVDSKGDDGSFEGVPAVQPVWLCSVQPSQAAQFDGVPIGYFLLLALAILVAIPVALTIRGSRVRRRRPPPATTVARGP